MSVESSPLANLSPAEKIFIIRRAAGQDAEYAPNPRLDGFAPTALVICATTSLIWHVFHMFFYWSNVDGDSLINYPIAWFWTNLFD